MSKILFVVTGADTWTLADGAAHPTGFWAEEAVAPYEAFRAAGPRGRRGHARRVEPTVDRASLAAEVNGGQENADRIAKALESFTELRHPVRLEASGDDYAAVFYPGGHGPMEDLAVNADSGRLLARALESGRPLGSSATGRPRCWPLSGPTAPTSSPATRSRRSPTPRRSRAVSPTARSGCSRTASPRPV